MSCNSHGLDYTVFPFVDIYYSLSSLQRTPPVILQCRASHVVFLPPLGLQGGCWRAVRPSLSLAIPSLLCLYTWYPSPAPIYSVPNISSCVPQSLLSSSMYCISGDNVAMVSSALLLPGSSLVTIPNSHSCCPLPSPVPSICDILMLIRLFFLTPFAGSAWLALVALALPCLFNISWALHVL